MKSYQMALRRIPENIRLKLQEAALREAKSLNQTALEALERGLGIAQEQAEFHDLDDLAGTWVPDPAFDRVIEELHQVDAGLWK
jgi:hypothetical protein